LGGGGKVCLVSKKFTRALVLAKTWLGGKEFFISLLPHAPKNVKMWLDV
jgi:hypothetical protein